MNSTIIMIITILSIIMGYHKNPGDPSLPKKAIYGDLGVVPSDPGDLGDVLCDSVEPCNAAGDPGNYSDRNL